MDYGISNMHGRTAKDELSKILQFAFKNKVDLIDTASSYGSSENVLGEVITDDNWRFVTKTPHFSDDCIRGAHVKQLKELFNQSLSNLGQKTMYGLLLHSCNDLLKPGGAALFQEMQRLKSIGAVKKIGVSVYNGEQIEAILDKFDIDLIQLPISILDQRLFVGGWLEKLKNNNIEIHARSVFLQGLLLMPLKSIPSYFLPVKEKIEMFSKFAEEMSLSKLELALGYVSSIHEIDQVLVGVNTVSQLKEVVQAAQVKIDPMDFIENSINDPAYVNPSLWKIK
jgi:aryl-alcohol dehydrogenase-like predicted oxidoreductase